MIGLDSMMQVSVVQLGKKVFKKESISRTDSSSISHVLLRTAVFIIIRLFLSLCCIPFLREDFILHRLSQKLFLRCGYSLLYFFCLCWNMEQLKKLFGFVFWVGFVGFFWFILRKIHLAK